MNHIEREVVSIVARLTKVPESRLAPDTDLRAELNVDSLLGLRIIAALEKHFDVTLPDDELDSYTTPAAIAAIIRRLRVGR